MKRIILLIMLICMIAMSAAADITINEEDLPISAITIEKAVNVRASASGNGKIIEKLAKGTEVSITGTKKAKDGKDYFSVELSDGKEGFIRADLLAYGDDYLTIVEAAAAVVPGASQSNTKNKGSTKVSGGSSKSSDSTPTNSGSGNYIGNKNTKKFHRSSCSHLPAQKNRVRFTSRDKAIKAGYKPCSYCNP